MYSDILKVARTKHIDNTKVISSFSINEKADLFKEHFPEYPILPGAFTLIFCMQEIKKYLLLKLGLRVILKEIIKTRFLLPINPNKNMLLTLPNTKINILHLLVFFEVTDDKEISYFDGLFRFEALEDMG